MGKSGGHRQKMWIMWMLLWIAC